MQIKHKTVRIRVDNKMSLEDLMKINQSHINFLKKTEGEKSVEKYIKHLKELVTKLPEVGQYITVDVVEIE